MGAVFMSNNVMTLSHTKHVDIRSKFVRKFLQGGVILVGYDQTEDNGSDIMTKNLGSLLHHFHVKKLVSNAATCLANTFWALQPKRTNPLSWMERFTSFVVSSAAEAELRALFLTCKGGIIIRFILPQIPFQLLFWPEIGDILPLQNVYYSYVEISHIDSVVRSKTHSWDLFEARISPIEGRKKQLNWNL